MLEQLGTALQTPESKEVFYKDFLRMESIVADYNRKPGIVPGLNNFLPQHKTVLSHSPVEDPALYKQQLELSMILETSSNHQVAMGLLRSSALFNDWNIDSWEPAMMETAIKIAQKWKKGWQQRS